MKLSRLQIRNFRGIRSATLLFPDHVVLIGDNNSGKSTVIEAIDLVLGPDRLGRRSPIDEHDFFAGRYLGADSGSEETSSDPLAADASVSPAVAGADSSNAGEEQEAIQKIHVEATITGLSGEQTAHFRDYIEWWNTEDGRFYLGPGVEGVDANAVVEALRVAFIGEYLVDEDAFEGKTYFARSLEESDAPQLFSRRDKQYCGFLYLRGLRTGRRALSLEYGSLLDIILRLKEIRPQMWETTITGLSAFDVASDPDLGISGVLKSIDAALNKYVPKEWGVEPHLRVSALTRDHLRTVITAFIATGEGDHSAPYYRQGAGTLNMLVLAMLAQVAEDKQNVIFAMEEPETAIPPYAQKRIVHEVRELSAQSIFTSHSPYVLEEFDLNETIVLSRGNGGVVTQASVSLPNSIRHKRYRQEFRTRFCEGLLSRRILITEGAAEASALPAVARRLAEIDSTKYKSLEALGICTIDAGTETQIADLGALYRSLGKTVYGSCDVQSPQDEAKIKANVDELFMHSEDGLETLVLKGTTVAALERFADMVKWPPHLSQQYPRLKDDVRAAVGDYFRWSKGNWGVADFLAQCSEDEIPEWLRDCCARLRELAAPESKQSATEGDGGEDQTANADAVPE